MRTTTVASEPDMQPAHPSGESSIPAASPASRKNPSDVENRTDYDAASDSASEDEATRAKLGSRAAAALRRLTEGCPGSCAKRPRAASSMEEFAQRREGQPSAERVSWLLALLRKVRKGRGAQKAEAERCG